MKRLYAFGLLAISLTPAATTLRADAITVTAPANPPVSDSLQISVRNAMTGASLFSDYRTTTEGANDTDSPNPLVVGPLPVRLPRAGWVQINEPNGGGISDIVTYDYTSDSFKLYSDPYDLVTLSRALRTQFGNPLGSVDEDPNAPTYVGLSQFFNPYELPVRPFRTILIAVSDADPPAPAPLDEPISDEPAAIPEPGTLLMLGLGGICLAAYETIRRKALQTSRVETPQV
jgi:hypothetical protein